MNNANQSLRWLLAVLVVLAGLLTAACPQNDDKGDTGTDDPTTEEPTTDEPDPEPECSYRQDPLPPAYDWTFSTVTVGQTTARYYLPAAPVGLVMLFDGGGGSLIWFNQIEARRLTEALVDEGYAVMALESDDPADGNFDATDDPTNVDVVNLQSAIAIAQGGGVPATVPIYYLGYSSGGFFASLAHRFEPASALALLNVRGDETTFDPATHPAGGPPTAWVIGRNDPLVDPDDGTLEANIDHLESFGIDYELWINEPIGATELAFARIADPNSAVSEGDSEQAIEDMRDADMLDDCDVPVAQASDLDLASIVLGGTFTPEFTTEATRQIDELYGAHAISSDFQDDIVQFFNDHP